MISKAEAGEYIGKTTGEPKHPTYYFEKGRLTQKHDDADNVGWHPVRAGEKVISMNLPEEAIDMLIEHPTAARYRIFAAGFYECNDPGSRLFEVYYDSKGNIISTHESRTAMVKKGEGKNAKEDEAMAYKALETANIAANEMTYNPLTGSLVLKP